MKSSTSSLRRACIALPGALFIAAGVIAVVAVKTSTSTSHATSTNQAKIAMSHFRALQEALETSLGATRSGEPEGSKKIHNRRAQQLYDDQAYPRKWVEAAEQITAANAAKQIASLVPLLAGPWTALGPNGVAADALVASESTGATVGTIYSGRATAIAVSPSCNPAGCTLFLGAAGGGVWKTTNRETLLLNNLSHHK